MNFLLKILLKILLGTALLLFSGKSVEAQNAADLKKNGEKYYENRRWADALDAFQKFQESKPGNEQVLIKIGICHLQLHHVEQARQFLNGVLERNPSANDPDLHYFWARLLHGEHDFQKAIAAYKNYLRLAPPRHPLRANVADNLKRCVAAMTISENPSVALVENLGERVNSAGDEFAPLPSVNHSNRIYFSAARAGCAGGQRDEEGLTDEFSGRWRADMFFTNLQSGGWDFATPLPSLLNSPREEIVLDFSENGQVLYYFRGFSQFAGEIFADTAGRKDEYALVPAVFQSPFQPEAGDQNPFFFNDSTLFFSSRRDGGLGGLDIWWTRRRSDGSWLSAQNLGAAVNSAYDELAPYLAPDGRTLFFSSNRLESMGGLDVFSTVFEDAKQAWAAPRNFGRGVNSAGDDSNFRFSKDGKTAFFASDRLESMGERDIFICYFKEEQAAAVARPNPIFFAEAGKNAAAETAETPAVAPVAPSQIVELEPFFYENDKDLSSPVNLKILKEAAAAVRPFPAVKLVVTVHTDETGPSKFDLYYGIKRAEIIGKTLLGEGLTTDRVVLWSAGSGFPIATNVLGQEENLVGRRLNRRVGLSAVVPLGAASPVELRTTFPAVAEVMSVAAGNQFLEKNVGLTFRVQLTTMRQILTDDAISMFEEMQIEAVPNAGEYKYVSGLCRKMSEAVALRKELVGQGFANAQIFAYLDGVRLSRQQAVGLVKKFPELAAFLKGG